MARYSRGFRGGLMKGLGVPTKKRKKKRPLTLEERRKLKEFMERL